MAGYNTEMKHGQEIFHVQTQDKMSPAYYIESIIYKSGKVLSSRRKDYTSFLNQPNLQDILNQMIEDQHKGILKEISEGKFDHL